MSHGGSPVSNASTNSAVNEQGAPLGMALHDMVRQGRSFSGREQNCCFLNLGGGKFADVSANSGFDFPDDGRAVAQTDWDGDGDIDVWLANRNGPQVRFLRNDLATPNHFLAIRLQGQSCNRDAIGARVEVVLGDVNRTRLIKTLRAGEGFLAQSSKSLHFGLGASQEVTEVIVAWPGGEQESFGRLDADGQYQLVQHTGQAQLWAPPKRELVLRPSRQPKSQSPGIARVVSTAQLPIPPLEYESFDGQRHWIRWDAGEIGREQGLSSESQGKPVLLNLWASWCRACLPELKEFGTHSQQLREAGVEIVALSVDRLDIEKGTASSSAPALVDKLGYAGTAGWATEGTAEIVQLIQEHLFDLHQPMLLPTSMLLDSQGRLAVLYRGPVEVEQLLADVAQLNGTGSGLSLPFPGRWHTRHRRLSPLDLAWQLVERGHLDQAIEYIAQNNQLLESHYNTPKLLTLVGNAELGRGRATNAVSYYRHALRLDINYGEAQNNLAWILSTHPDEKLRDGVEAIRLATLAVQQKRGDVVSMLDTLSAAYAEDGQFEQAVKIAKRAVEIARASGRSAQAAPIGNRLKQYEAGMPHRSN